MAAMSRRPSPSSPSRRTIALKRADGEPLTRADIQYDVLDNIFHDTHDVFTDPYPSDVKPAPKICFRNLYLKYILHSPKATKALKDKMLDSQTFAEDFGMLALLVNVGRVNTTMSCKHSVVRLSEYTDSYMIVFPEMKTAIRTYHPIPALQRTNGNLQDAPRIKHILKSSILDGEQANQPSIPVEILDRVVRAYFTGLL
jgi:Ino eighty subunit 1